MEIPGKQLISRKASGSRGPGLTCRESSTVKIQPVHTEITHSTSRLSTGIQQRKPWGVLPVTTRCRYRSDACISSAWATRIAIAMMIAVVRVGIRIRARKNCSARHREM